MLDLLFVVILVLFFGAALLMVRLCDRVVTPVTTEPAER